MRYAICGAKMPGSLSVCSMWWPPGVCCAKCIGSSCTDGRTCGSSLVSWCCAGESVERLLKTHTHKLSFIPRNRAHGALPNTLTGWYEDDWYQVNLKNENISCTADQMRQAAEGHLTTEALMWNQNDEKTISGMSSEDFRWVLRVLWVYDVCGILYVRCGVFVCVCTQTNRLHARALGNLHGNRSAIEIYYIVLHGVCDDHCECD